MLLLMIRPVKQKTSLRTRTHLFMLHAHDTCHKTDRVFIFAVASSSTSLGYHITLGSWIITRQSRLYPLWKCVGSTKKSKGVHLSVSFGSTSYLGIHSLIRRLDMVVISLDAATGKPKTIPRMGSCCSWFTARISHQRISRCYCGLILRLRGTSHR